MDATEGAVADDCILYKSYPCFHDRLSFGERSDNEMTFGFHPVEKPNHKRGKKKRRNVTSPTDKARKEIARRSMEKFNVNTPCCEICGRITSLTSAHLENASQMGSGSVPWNLALICGTHGWVGYCHHWADNTPKGREWKKNYALELVEYYQNGQGRKYWGYEE